MQSNSNIKLKPSTGALILSIYTALALSTLFVFLQVRNFEFTNYDDDVHVYENQTVLNGLSLGGVVSAFTTVPAGSCNWLPLTWLSFMLDYQLFGLNAGAMHLENVLLHILNTLLLFTLIRKMTGSLWPSAFVAAVFALHPMHVESVAWITERKDVLSGLFCMLTLLTYAGYVRRPSAYRYLATLALFAVGLMAKPMLVTLPFVLLLLDYWPLNRFAAPGVKIFARQTRTPPPVPERGKVLYRVIIEKIPFFALSVISSVITFLVQRGGGAMTSINVIPFEARVANAFLSYARYMGKMFWPQKLSVFYPHIIGGIPLWQIAICALLIVIISALVIYFGRKRKYLPVGWFWFIGTLIPVIGLVQVGEQSIADRYTYIPYIGLFIMIAWGIPELLSKLPYLHIVLGASMMAVIAGLGIGTYRQVSYWKNSSILFSHAIAATPNNHLAYINLGIAYGELGRLPDAVEAFKQAIRIDPHAEAYTNLGIAYGKLGRLQEAVEAFRQAVRIKPNYAKAYNNLGIAYGQLGRWQEAIDALKQATKIKPDYAEAYNVLGIAYDGLGHIDDAIDSYRQAARIKPNYAEAYFNIGDDCSKLGRRQEAIDALRQAIKIKPDYAEAHLRLGIIYLSSGDKGSAVKEYEILKNLNSEYANRLFNLINK